MRAIAKTILSLLSVSLFTGVSFADSYKPKDYVTVKEVVMNINDVYFLDELKTEKPVRFVVNGMFPNSCYSFGRIEVGHESDSKHSVKVIANVLQGICAMVLSPYTQEDSLGLLKAGKHTVLFLSSDGVASEKSILVH